MNVSFIKRIFKKSRSANKAVSTIDDVQVALIKQGREEFKKLLEKGMSVPVALL